MRTSDSTICALISPPGKGAVALVRISGPEAKETVGQAWEGKDLSKISPRVAVLGGYRNLKGEIIDEVLLTYFKAPASFTGEDVVEIAMHGSPWIQKALISDLVDRGIRMALPGEFSQRAFLNGKMDLAQAEGIADLISSDSAASHRLALSQMKGYFSRQLEQLREKLIEFASLLELELDFSEEEVEFADRSSLLNLIDEILHKIESLADSYSLGKVLKDGIPVAIAGVPNAGKSSLLNLLSGEDKAIVTEIPGTTRDLIEEKIEIKGVAFRFIDTAGLHHTDDKIEKIGIEKARQMLQKASIIIWMLDAAAPLPPQMEELNDFLNLSPYGHLILLLNKCDLISKPNKITKTKNNVINFDSDSESSISENEKIEEKGNLKELDNSIKSDSFPEWENISSKKFDELSNLPEFEVDKGFDDLIDSNRLSEFKDLSSFNSLKGFDNLEEFGLINFSTLTHEGLDVLKYRLSEFALSNLSSTDVVVTNARHYDALKQGATALRRAKEGIESGISTDFVAQDVREALHHLATVTGSVSNPDLLHSIFSRFCIGK